MEARKYENSTALEDDDVGCDMPVCIAAKSLGRCVVGSCLMNGANLPIRNATLTANARWPRSSNRATRSSLQINLTRARIKPQV